MSEVSYNDERLIEPDDTDDPYDLSLALEDTEDDFNIEDITEDQVKEILADEENRFLLDDDVPLESTSSQINIIDRRVADESSGKDKLNSSSFRNTGNLITISCEEEDEEESELDDRRHSKFKSERVIKDNVKKSEEKNIPETLEAVVAQSRESQSANKGQPCRGNSGYNLSNLRGKARNFVVPSSRPFIGSNSLSSMGLLPTPLQALNRIHVNPNFKPITTLGPRPGPSMEYNSLRHMNPRGFQQPRMRGPFMRPGSRPIPSFADMNPAIPYQMIRPDSVESLMNTHSMNEFEYEDFPSNRLPMKMNNSRPPLFSEPFVDHWPNQVGIQQPWKQMNRPAISNLQRMPGIFNSDSMGPPLLSSFQRGMPVNSSLFGPPPRHTMQTRFARVPMFNQQSFPMINSHSMEIPRNLHPHRDPNLHPGSPLKHQMPGRPENSTIHTVHNRPVSTLARSVSHHNNMKTINSHPIASTSSYTYRHGRDANSSRASEVQPSTSSTKDFKMPQTSPRSIHKVTSSPGQRTARPTNSNVNLKNIRPIKSINCNVTTTTPTDARKAALLKTKAARRLLQKENMNRVVSSVKQIDVVQTVTSSTSGDRIPTASSKTQQQQQPTQAGSKPQPVQSVEIELIIDEEYKKKLEEQKRKREEFIRQKEENRQRLRLSKPQGSSQATPSLPKASQSSPLSSPTPSSSTPRDHVPVNAKKFPKPLPLKRRPPLSSSESSSETEAIKLKRSSAPSDSRKVLIEGLALTTEVSTITRLCSSIAPIEDCFFKRTGTENKAIITFKTPQDARRFQSKYQRHLVDLCVMQISLLCET